MGGGEALRDGDPEKVEEGDREHRAQRRPEQQAIAAIELPEGILGVFQPQGCLRESSDAGCVVGGGVQGF